jgi:hypothetical protein
MNCIGKSRAVRIFLVRFVAMVSANVVLYTFTFLAFHRFHPRGMAAYLLASLPALPIAGVLGVFALYLREEQDDFQRSVMIQSILWSTGLLLAATNLWGFLEKFIQVPHIQMIFVFPLFCAFWVVVAPLVQWRYR